MKVKYPLAVVLGLILLYFAALFWFLPNSLLTGDIKYIVAAIELCAGLILVGFSVQSI